MNGLSMVTYIIMVFAVALLAGLTGGGPSWIIVSPRAGSTEGDDADANAVTETSAHNIARALPFEILDALAEVGRLSDRKPIGGQFRDQDRADPSVPPMGLPSSSQTTEPDRLAPMSAHRSLLVGIIDSLMQGAQFIALTGAPGVGKTVMASSVREELTKRSVRTRWIDGSGGSGIHLRTIMFQFLGKPECDVDPDAIERLFDAMTEREAPDQRLVLIIDDAQQLFPDAIGYLRLLASVAVERMPQIVFVGDPSFWDIADQAAQAGFSNLITARFELEPLSLEETRDAGLASEVATLLEGGLAAQSELGPEVVIKRPVIAHTARALVPALNILCWDRTAVRMAGAAAVLVGSIGAVSYWMAPLGVDRIRAAGRTAPERPGATSASPDATIVVRLPFSALTLQSQLDSPDVESASTPQVTASVATSEIIEPPVLVAQHIGAATAARKRAARSETVQTRGTIGGYVTRANRGIWLFPPNANAGANS
jgi:type II secretory pathway predicted ATPase ExeA